MSVSSVYEYSDAVSIAVVEAQPAEVKTKPPVKTVKPSVRIDIKPKISLATSPLVIQAKIFTYLDLRDRCCSVPILSQYFKKFDPENAYWERLYQNENPAPNIAKAIPWGPQYKYQDLYWRDHHLNQMLNEQMKPKKARVLTFVLIMMAALSALGLGLYENRQIQDFYIAAEAQQGSAMQRFNSTFIAQVDYESLKNSELYRTVAMAVVCLGSFIVGVLNVAVISPSCDLPIPEIQRLRWFTVASGAASVISGSVVLAGDEHSVAAPLAITMGAVLALHGCKHKKIRKNCGRKIRPLCMRITACFGHCLRRLTARCFS